MSNRIEWSGASISRTVDGDPTVLVPLPDEWIRSWDARLWAAFDQALDDLLPNMLTEHLTVTVDPAPNWILHISSPNLYGVPARDLRAAIDSAGQEAADRVRGEFAEDDTVGRDWVGQLSS